MAISDNGDTKTYHNELGQAHEALGVVVVNGDTLTYTNSLGQPKEAMGVVVLAGGSGGGEGGPVAWDDVTGKPATFPPVVGTTASTAKAGDYVPTWGEVTNKPAVIAAGATQAEARTAIGALNAALVGVANGVAPLDASGLVPLQHLNVSGLSFRGAWDASTNTPPLLDGEGSVGDFYKVSVPGTYDFGNGSYTFAMGDWVMFAAGVWQRLGVHETVASVNGKIGTVQLTAADVGALPDTYVPSWAEVTDKPVPRGVISAPIPALYCRKSAAQSVPHNSQVVVTWENVIYDQFGMKSGNTFIVPSWATHVRVSGGLLYAPHATGYRYHNIRMNGVHVASNRSLAVSTSSQVEVPAISPIVPVTAGAVIEVQTWQNSTAPLDILSTSGTWLQIELFTTN